MYDGYSSEVQQILKRHWSILMADDDLVEVLPSITYRRGPNLKDLLVHSSSQVQRAQETWLSIRTICSYPCSACTFCKYLPKIKEFTNPCDGNKYKIRHFINCKTKGIIYVALCNCPKLYVGKTIKEFRRRISQHAGTILRDEDTPLARHIKYYHNNDPNMLKFWGGQKVVLDSRRGNLDQKLLREEARWIHRLKSLKHGLNEGFSFTPFI